jgi:hypothetical protein
MKLRSFDLMSKLFDFHQAAIIGFPKSFNSSVGLSDFLKEQKDIFNYFFPAVYLNVFLHTVTSILLENVFELI